MIDSNVPLGIIPTVPCIAAVALLSLVGGVAITPSLPSQTHPLPVMPCQTGDVSMWQETLI